MRIIGGEHRGRRIAAPEGRATRPMLDRVREAVFSTVTPWLAGARVLDLFAGSGSLGLEALSRGAATARFVERDERVLGLLRSNARELGLLERSTLVPGDALSPFAWGEGRFDLVFLDPPYPMLSGKGLAGKELSGTGPPGEGGTRTLVIQALESLVREHLAPDGVVVFHAPRDGFDPRLLSPDLVVRRRVYGTNAILYVGADDGEGEDAGAARDATADSDEDRAAEPA